MTAPKTPSGPDVTEGSDDGGRARATTVLWTTIAVATITVFLVLVFTGTPLYTMPDEAADPSTPADVAPGAPDDPPRLTGRRTAHGVLFTWTSSDRPRGGDTWEWRRPETDESRRTETARLFVRAAGTEEVCLQVRLIRESFASEFAQACVGARPAAGSGS